MKTKGEIEAENSRALVQFEIDYMGRGPKEARTYIIEDMLVVRLKGVLTPAEEQLTKTRSPEAVLMSVCKSKIFVPEMSPTT